LYSEETPIEATIMEYETDEGKPTWGLILTIGIFSSDCVCK
jgi:hypothetical protein